MSALPLAGPPDEVAALAGGGPEAGVDDETAERQRGTPRRRRVDCCVARGYAGKRAFASCGLPYTDWIVSASRARRLIPV